MDNGYSNKIIYVFVEIIYYKIPPTLFAQLLSDTCTLIHSREKFPNKLKDQVEVLKKMKLYSATLFSLNSPCMGPECDSFEKLSNKQWHLRLALPHVSRQLRRAMPREITAAMGRFKMINLFRKICKVALIKLTKQNCTVLCLNFN